MAIDEITYSEVDNVLEVFVEYGYPNDQKTLIGRLTDNKEREKAKEMIVDLNEAFQEMVNALYEYDEMDLDSDE